LKQNVQNGRARRLKRMFVAVMAAVAVSTGLMLGAAAPARAQSELQSIYNQLEMLREQLATTRGETQDLQRTVYAGAPAPEGGAAASAGGQAAESGAGRRLAVIETRVDEYEERLRKVFGRFDELGNQIDRLGGRIEKLVADVDFRLNALEPASRAAAANSPPASQTATANQAAGAAPETTEGASIAVESGGGYKPSQAPRSLGTIPLNSADAVEQPVEVATAAPATLLPIGTPEEQYQFAMSLMNQMQWDEADLAFEDFVRLNAGHTLVENAAYWRGESFYARRLFGDAARLYAVNFQQYPNGSKASANLVKLGLSLVNLERFPEACQTFDKLAQDFPEMPVNVSQAAQRGRAQAGCS